MVLGGGILADVSDPYIHHNAFVNNGSDEIFSGGASYLTSDGTEWSFGDLNRFQNHNPRCDIDEFRLSNNLYNGNDAQYGNTMANRFHENQFDMSGSIFDVFDCSNEENSVSSVWVKVESEASVDYEDGAGQLCAFTSPNVYVDPSINQECLDEGCGFQNNPFKTINRALEMINPTQESQVTMNLAAGTYSPSTNNESFPILLQSNMTLLGLGDSLTIIDAEEINTVLSIIDCSNSFVGNLTISGGNNSNSYEIYPGGGVYIRSSNPEMYNVTISDNFSIADGGGIHLMVSLLRISNSNIFDNFSNYWGGGIYNETSYVDFFNVSINNNTSLEMGGGIHCNLCYDSNFGNMVIKGNSSPLGSAIYSWESIISVNHSTIVDNIGNTLIYLDSDSTHNNNQNFNISNSILWNNQSNNFYDLNLN